MKGHMGKILRVNLTNKTVKTIDTKQYEEWVGGHGIGSAIFWDLVASQLPISPYDPKNVVTIMTSPLTGTLAPSTGRTEVQGIGLQSYPIEWFTRGNFGGRFGMMLKNAGWDGIVIEGKADKPCWINIVDDDVDIADASDLWGLDAWETQEEIWRKVSGGKFGKWIETSTGRYTTQRPAVLTISQVGELGARIASLVHDAGNAAGQGGFGGIFGAKNLKAISVIGAKGAVEVADPKALFEAWKWAIENYRGDIETRPSKTPSAFGAQPTQGFWGVKEKNMRPSACAVCPKACRAKFRSGIANESQCVEFAYYSWAVSARYGGPTIELNKAADLTQKYAINNYELLRILVYLRTLNAMGVLGKGKAIDTDLPFDILGTAAFVEELIRKIIQGKDIGLALREGGVRAAKQWGRLEQDLKTGVLAYPYWGCPEHGYDPRTEAEWGYGSILGERDINEHDFNFFVYWYPLGFMATGNFPISAEECAKICSEKLIPYTGDPFMLDYSDEGIYSEHFVKLVAWHRHYTRFWKQSVGFCDWMFADLVNAYGPNNRGLTPDGEVRFFNAVTGKNITFAEGMEIGRRIWNLDNAIWVLQGRHRDVVKFADYIYEVPFPSDYPLPMYIKGEWKFASAKGRKIDRAKFEDFKTKFYTLEGWSTSSGWPTRSTLEALNLKYVADLLAAKGKLG
jgi:aldehyde:ferredoxin oxidoreductase